MSHFQDFDMSLDIVCPPALCYSLILNIYLIMYLKWLYSGDILLKHYIMVSLLVFSLQCFIIQGTRQMLRFMTKT